jgi:glutamate 5-kinase
MTKGPLATLRLVVVKIGSSLLVEQASGELRVSWLDSLSEDIAGLRAAGLDVVIVSSGAVALGRRSLGLGSGVLKLEESQAAASVGQIRLAHAYREALDRRQLETAQILLTLGDTEQRRRYLNARNTLKTLLGLGAVPVVNENDTVATSEIRYGDNDRLAARVAQMISADCLVLLSDVDGLYSADPAIDRDAAFIPVVEKMSGEIEAMATGVRTPTGTGGMVTKIAAARIATDAGCDVIIASGRRSNPLLALAEGARHTRFPAQATPRAARKQWIAGSLELRGAVVVDNGAASALGRGNSLLAAGLVAVEGEFHRGDAVAIRDQRGVTVAQGLIAYSSAEARRLRGRRSEEFEKVLGYAGRDELVHRDDMVVFRQREQDEQAG